MGRKQTLLFRSDKMQQIDRSGSYPKWLLNLSLPKKKNSGYQKRGNPFQTLDWLNLDLLLIKLQQLNHSSNKQKKSNLESKGLLD